MPNHVQQRTVELSSYPDLVVIYSIIRVNRLSGLLLGFGPEIARSLVVRPDGPY